MERHLEAAHGESMRTGWTRMLVATLVMALSAVTFGTGIADARVAARPAESVTAETEFFNLLNAERVEAGRAPLAYNANLVQDARAWSGVMAPTGGIFHSRSYGDDTARSVANWSAAGENVGKGPDVAVLHNAFVNSPSHYANIVGDFNQVGVGVVYTPTTIYVTFRFAKGSLPGPSVQGTSASLTPAVAGAQVRRLYLAFFEREPDASGQSFWVNKLMAGLPLGNISSEFVKSREFVATYGKLSNGQFVTLVYQNVMDRAPDAGGHAYWTDKLNRGMSRGNVMTNFSESAEFRSKTG